MEYTIGVLALALIALAIYKRRGKSASKPSGKGGPSVGDKPRQHKK